MRFFHGNVFNTGMVGKMEARKKNCGSGLNCGLNCTVVLTTTILLFMEKTKLRMSNILIMILRLVIFPLYDNRNWNDSDFKKDGGGGLSPCINKILSVDFKISKLERFDIFYCMRIVVRLVYFLSLKGLGCECMKIAWFGEV